MKMRKWMAMLLAGTMCTGMLAGCGTTESSGSADKSIAEAKKYEGEMTFVISHKDEYLGALDQAAKSAAETLGVTLTTMDCADDMDKQIEYVKAAEVEGANAVMVVLADDTRADEIIEAAGDMKVVFVNRIPADTSVLDENHVYVGSDEETSGTYQGEMLAEQLKAEGKDSIDYVLIEGTAGLLHTVKRSENVIKTLNDAGIQTNLLKSVNCDFDRNKAMEQVNVMVADGVDLSNAVIISNNDAMALGALEALKQNNVTPMKVVGIDGTNAGLQAVADGSMAATVYQSAVGQGTTGVQAAINLAVGSELTNDIAYDTADDNEFIIWVPFEKITADNVASYY